MTIVEVRTQSELDVALRDGADKIHIWSSADVWVTINDSGSSHVDAWDSSHVVARGSSHVVARDSSHVVARGSSHVDARDSSHVDAWDSSHVDARDSSHVVAWGSSHVDAWGSSHVDAWGSSHVVARDSSHVDAWDSSHVDAWGSSHVDARKYTAVHKHNTLAVLAGDGHVIDMTVVDLTTVEAWCEFHGVTISDGHVTLFKATDGEFVAGQAYKPTTYAPGTTVVAADWRADGECGGGLHLGPTAQHATAYRSDAQRWLACRVAVADVCSIVSGGVAKVKARACEVLYEVDRYGVAVEVAVAS